MESLNEVGIPHEEVTLSADMLDRVANIRTYINDFIKTGLIPGEGPKKKEATPRIKALSNTAAGSAACLAALIHQEGNYRITVVMLFLQILFQRILYDYSCTIGSRWRTTVHSIARDTIVDVVDAREAAVTRSWLILYIMRAARRTEWVALSFIHCMCIAAAVGYMPSWSCSALRCIPILEAISERGTFVRYFPYAESAVRELLKNSIEWACNETILDIGEARYITKRESADIITRVLALAKAAADSWELGIELPGVESVAARPRFNSYTGRHMISFDKRNRSIVRAKDESARHGGGR